MASASRSSANRVLNAKCSRSAAGSRCSFSVASTACSDDFGTSPTATGSCRIGGLSRIWCAARSVAVRNMVWLGRPGNIALLRLDARELHHLGPLLGFLGDELAELGRRTRNQRVPEVGKLRLQLGIGESRIDLLVERVDDFGRRPPRRADAIPQACFVAPPQI